MIFAIAMIMFVVGSPIVFFIWMLNEENKYNKEVLDFFEFRERMSNAKFQASVQSSLISMRKE